MTIAPKKLTDETARQIYIRFHTGTTETQADIATALHLPKSTVNTIVLGLGRFAFLKQEYPHLARTTKKMAKPKPEPKPKKVPVMIEPAPKPVAVKEAEEGEDCETAQIASSLLEHLPGLSATGAVVFAALAPGEVGSLLAMLDRPLCPRLEKYCPPKGRPKASV